MALFYCNNTVNVSFLSSHRPKPERIELDPSIYMLVAMVRLSSKDQHVEIRQSPELIVIMNRMEFREKCQVFPIVVVIFF